MSPSNSFITRPVLTTVCSLIIVILGLVAISVLPIENLPDITPPTVTATFTYVGTDAAAVEQGVTKMLEQDMESMTSNSSSDGVSNTTMSFFSGTDGNINQVAIQNKGLIAKPKLPQEVRATGVTVEKASNSVLIVYNFGSKDKENAYSVQELQGRLRSVGKFENMTLKITDEDSIVRLSGVDRATIGDENYQINGYDFAVRMTLYRLSGSNAVEVASGVEKVLEELQHNMPPGMHVEKIYSTAGFIDASICNVANSL